MMMDFTPQFVVQIFTYIGTFGVVYGGLSQRLRELEKKMDRHNHLMEDMAAAKHAICRMDKQIDRLEERQFEHGGAL